MSPRRWGKTSLVNKVAESFSNDKERIIIRMDIFACRSEYDFYNVFIYLCHVRAVPQIKGFCLFGWQKKQGLIKKAMKVKSSYVTPEMKVDAVVGM